ncbi:hypothetical protein [Agarilytica rhodophyticola]|uniref:hypothetical protein n=1 Tax=Agarilytica rhodophyticola TaxID=1737490 RepID=UPI000B349397|nr:hypothetical protein [Agarilytica rhodophyticola]
MYFESNFDLKPAPNIKDTLERPSKVFKKIYSLVTGGLTPTERLQTEVMLSILQSVNVKLREIDIDHLVKLSADSTDIYCEKQNGPKDLSEAIQSFAVQMQGDSAKLYKSFMLVLTHDYEGLRFLIEISIKRRVKVGESPVHVTVSAVINEFKRALGETDEKLQDRLQKVIANSKLLAEKRKKYLKSFKGFVEKLNVQMSSIAHLEKTLEQITRAKMMVPHSRNCNSPRRRSQASSLHHDYYCLDDCTDYLWSWFFTMCDYASNSDFSSFELNDESGATLALSFDRYSDGIESSSTSGNDSDSDSSSSWIGDFFSGGDSGSSSSSSCSSCSSCGGGD